MLSDGDVKDKDSYASPDRDILLTFSQFWRVTYISLIGINGKSDNTTVSFLFNVNSPSFKLFDYTNT